MGLRSLIAFASILVIFQFGKAQLFDDFSDGDFSNNPAWSGNTSAFIVNTDNKLQLNNSFAASSYLSTPNTMTSLDDQEWRFYVKQNFSPSGSNFGRVYLVSDNSNLVSSVNGYFLQFGEAGSNDAIELFMQADMATASVCRATNGMIASSFEAGVRVVRNNAGTWSLYVDYTGGNNYNLEASGTNSIFNSSTDFGVSCTYTISNADNFYYDDVYAGPIIIDTDPPVANSATAISDVLVDVIFNEPVEAITAGTNTNYSIDNGIGNPASVTTDADPTLVHLNLGTPLVNGQNYVLTVTNVEDVAGNAMSSQNVPFTYFVPASAQPGDVRINEIMVDPTPVVGLPDAEWVEFYNASTEFFDLNGWEFAGATLPTYSLAPGAYVLLIDEDDDAEFNTIPNRIGVPGFPALTNGGEHIWLISNGGDTIDQVTYSDDWYQDPDKDDGGWTLEQINPEAACGGAGNWIASNDPNGGTPGMENSVYDTTPDLDGPELLGGSILTATELLLLFNETLEPASVGIGDIVLSPTIAVSAVAVAGSELDQISVTLAAPIDTGTVYTVNVQNVQDCSGNTMMPGSVQVVVGYSPEPGEVLINEIMADPSPVVGLPEVEYIELLNTGVRPLELGFLTFNGTLFPAGSILQAGALVIVCHEDDVPFFDGIYGQTIGLPSFSLVNSGTLLELRNGAQAIDWVEYSDQWHSSSSKRDGGWSLERKDPQLPCGFVQMNWGSSTNNTGGTPGEENSILDDLTDTSPPSLERLLYYSDTQVGLLFDEPMDSISALSASYTFTNGLSVLSADPVYYDYREVVLSVAPNMVFGTVYELTVNNIQDCSGNDIGSFGLGMIAVPDTAVSKDVLINELLSDPRGSGSDFVELFNNSSKVINMRNWKLGKEGEDVQVEDAEVITDLPILLFPGDYMLVSENSLNIATEYPLSHSENFVETDLPSYSNAEGTVVLQSNSNVIIDFFRYDEDMHYPLLNSTDGVSLERIDPNRATSDRTNWHSAAENVGWATPGYQNSQYSPTGIASSAIEVDPEVFSPDNDGYQDVIDIKYTFDQAGFTANITIFDSKGRPIRKLAQNELLGTSGTISWDGMTDDREKARIGAYIIFAEVFDLSGNVKQFKNTCVLAHQLN